MKEFIPKLLLMLLVIAIGIGIFWRFVGFEPQASCVFLIAVVLIGSLLGWGFHEMKGGK